MVARKTVSKRLRFEVFKRDKFRCVYCGAVAPNTVLEVREIPSEGPEDAAPGTGFHVDHVVPLAGGGANTILNFVTACSSCNLGKGAIPLDDHSALAKQRAQLDDAAIKREQLEMMGQWQRELAALDDSGVDVTAALWTSLLPGSTVTPHGREQLAKSLRRFGPELVLDAVRTAVQTYVRRKPDGAWEDASLADAFSKIAGICVNRRRQEKIPELRELYYVRGIIRNRFPDDWDNAEVMRLLPRAAKAGASVEVLQEQARDATTYWRWKKDVEHYIEDLINGEYEMEPPAPPAPLSARTQAAVLACQAKWGATVNVDAVRTRTERGEGYASTGTLWISWTLRHAVAFSHWCALMDWADAQDRLEAFMFNMPLPPYENVNPGTLAGETTRALVRVMVAAEKLFGKEVATMENCLMVAKALRLGFTEHELMENLPESATSLGWRVDVDLATMLAQRLRLPSDPFAEPVAKAL